MLLKSYFWSDVLSNIFERCLNESKYDPTYTAGPDIDLGISTKKYLTELLENIYANDCHSYNKVLVIRGGSNVLNHKAVNYRLDTVVPHNYVPNPERFKVSTKEHEQSSLIRVDEVLAYMELEASMLIKREPILWKFAKKAFEDNDFRFIDCKAYFESEILCYYKTKNIIKEGKLVTKGEDDYIIGLQPKSMPKWTKDTNIEELELSLK